MISRFFIDRPIFAAVLSIVITLAGAIALLALPIAQYPHISPPIVSLTCNYPGASAQVVAEAVAAPIEQQVNGVENMMYMSSACTNDGTYSLSVTFEHGVDLNMAQVLVQNRVGLALPNLPDVIKQTGVVTRKRSPDILLVIAINSPADKDHPEGRYDQLYLSNFALMRVRDELLRVEGVSDISMLGQRDYSMRVWVDPERLSAMNLTAGDVANALREQNMPVALGQIGQPPAPPGQPLQVTLDTLGRLKEPEQFGDVVIRSTRDGRVVRLKDVARIQLAAKNQDVSCKVNGKPSASLAIFQLPDANALDTAVLVKAKMKELSSEFPEGVNWEIRYDTTPFISESIREVINTLLEAVILVALVVLLFLQNWRSAVIPLIAVPVAIIGTLAIMALMGFSLNNLTLFGLVLAIGIVVDDAIVVVESVEHHIEHGLSPRDATIKAMDEVSGPVIAIGLVLTAVFVPCAFIGGIVGQFFRQFALTIAGSTLISTINSLTLSPALAALLLRPKGKQDREVLPMPAFAALGGFLGWVFLGPYLAPFLVRGAAATGLAALAAKPETAHGVGLALGLLAGGLAAWPLNWLLGGCFRAFNAGFRTLTRWYAKGIGMLLRVSVLVLLVYGGLLFLTYTGFNRTPKGFIPSQDMGYLLVNIQLPDAASDERTRAVMDEMERMVKDTALVKGVKFTQTMSGQSILLNAFGSNFGSMFLILDEFHKRQTPELYGVEIIKTLQALFDGKDAKHTLLKMIESGDPAKAKIASEILGAKISIFPPPPVRGVERAGGFQIMIEDRGDLGPNALQDEVERMVAVAKKATLPGTNTPAFENLFSVFRANVPQLYAEVNRAECRKKGVQLQDFFDTLRIYLGSLYVNDFNRFGRTWQVIVQAEPKFRNGEEDIKRLKVRNAYGTMVPVGTLAEIQASPGPLVLTRYNMYAAAQINGAAAKGISTRQAIDMMEELVRDPKAGLPPSMSFEWTELAYLELNAGNKAMTIFGFAVVMVFLVLAAQYESWSLPLAIILVVPMCLLGGIIGVNYFGAENNIVSKMGFNFHSGKDINIFTQIGFVVLIGLASKNAILIVEFAKAKREQGDSGRDATLEACRLRLRPIVMTSLAFILGVVPLIVSQGAGAEMRQTLGTTVFSGMLGVTLFGLLLTPVFFYVIDWVGHSRVFVAPETRWVGLTARVLLLIITLGIPLLVVDWPRWRAQRQKRAKRADFDDFAEIVETDSPAIEKE